MSGFALLDDAVRGLAFLEVEGLRGIALMASGGKAEILHGGAKKVGGRGVDDDGGVGESERGCRRERGIKLTRRRSDEKRKVFKSAWAALGKRCEEGVQGLAA
jgi:hypothetical protein